MLLGIIITVIECVVLLGFADKLHIGMNNAGITN